MRTDAMRLWLLRPVSDDLDPWAPWVENNTYGIVVRARTDDAARELAASHAEDEGPDARLLSKYSACVELTGDGPAEVVMEEYIPAG
jgi:hypothetical protein